MDHKEIQKRLTDASKKLNKSHELICDSIIDLTPFVKQVYEDSNRKLLGADLTVLKAAAQSLREIINDLLRYMS